MAEVKQLCTFLIDNTAFGVDVKHVREVIRYQNMTRVPLAPDVLRGLINLRGEIVAALDMRRRLGLPDRHDIQPTNVVVHRDEGAISLLVDEIGDVVEVDASTFEPPPETLKGVARELVAGVYKLEGRLLLLLDTARALQIAEPTAS